MIRPILIITLGFLTGIIWGLYFNIVPFVFLILIFLSLIVRILNIKSDNNGVRVLKIFIKNNTILIFLISALISSIYLGYCNKRYEMVYNKFSKKEIIGTVISNKKETEYKDTYKISC